MSFWSGELQTACDEWHLHSIDDRMWLLLLIFSFLQIDRRLPEFLFFSQFLEVNLLVKSLRDSWFAPFAFLAWKALAFQIRQPEFIKFIFKVLFLVMIKHILPAAKQCAASFTFTIVTKINRGFSFTTRSKSIRILFTFLAFLFVVRSWPSRSEMSEAFTTLYSFTVHWKRQLVVAPLHWLSQHLFVKILLNEIMKPIKVLFVLAIRCVDFRKYFQR